MKSPTQFALILAMIFANLLVGVSARADFRDCSSAYALFDSAGGPIPRNTLDTMTEPLRNARRIPINKLSDVTEVTNSRGINHHRILKGTFEGRPVFIKVSKVKSGEVGTPFSHRFRNEVAWTRRLDELGIGAKFVAVSHIDGHEAVITEMVPGFDLKISYDSAKALKMLPPGFEASPTLVRRLERIRDVLAREEIDAYDLQLRVNDGVAVIVDPELFRAADFGTETIRHQTEEIDAFLHVIPRRRDQ